MNYITKKILNEVYKKRKKEAHKGEYGRLLCIVGNEWNTGSPIFVGLAAYMAGCDLVFLIGPKRAMDVASFYSPLLITKPLDGNYLEEKHLPKILEFIQKTRPKAVVIGNGLWRENETLNAILKIIQIIDIPLVIDADAIRAVALKKDVIFDKNCCLTPHLKEYEELFNKKLPEKIEKKAKIVKEDVYNINCGIKGYCPLIPKICLVLKGYNDIITNGKEVWINKSGSPYMTVGGCGDTLAGICGAFLAKNIDCFTSLKAATFINGLAGQIASKKLKESFTPIDLIKTIPKVIS